MYLASKGALTIKTLRKTKLVLKAEEIAEENTKSKLMWLLMVYNISVITIKGGPEAPMLGIEDTKRRPQSITHQFKRQFKLVMMKM